LIEDTTVIISVVILEVFTAPVDGGAVEDAEGDVVLE